MKKIVIYSLLATLFCSCDWKVVLNGSSIKEPIREVSVDTLYKLQRVNKLIVKYPKSYEALMINEYLYYFRETDTLKENSIFSITFSSNPDRAISEVVDFCKIELRKVDSLISYSDLETRLLESDSLILFTGRYLKKSDKIGFSIAILKTNENVYIINHHIPNESPDTLTHKSNIFEDLINKLKID